jgi:hypothetical protein
MRFIVAIGLTLGLGSLIATPGVAQTPSTGSMSQITNSCIDLARQRGWTESDLETSRREVRNFVARCVQGREARAQQRPKQKKQKQQR